MADKPRLGTASELAKELGITAARISQLKKKGRIQRALHGDLIDLDYAKVLLSESTQLQQNSKIKPAGVESETPEVRAARNIHEKTSGKGLMEKPMAERLIANLKAQLMTFEVQRESGELLLATEVKAAESKMCAAIKNTLIGIPDRISALCAATSDPKEVKKLLREELRQVLTNLADGIGEPCPHCGTELKIF